VSPSTGSTDPVRRSTIAEVLAYQAEACAKAGSPLYARVLEGVLDDYEADGIAARVLAGHDDDPFGSVLGLRLLGAVHRIVLDGRAPDLAAHYPSVGGDPTRPDPAAAFLATLREHEQEVVERLADGVQTNEVGRSAVLVGGYAEVARRWGLPLRVLEVGTSAGLNLRWDHFAYDTGTGAVAGDPDSPLRFAGLWEGDPPELPSSFTVAERRGCDPNPLDPTTDAGYRTLASFVWPDQVERLRRLAAAVEVARRVPATIERARAIEWIEQHARPVPGVATVVVHSIVLQYLSKDDRRRLPITLASVGEHATDAAPLAWLRMEPAGDLAELRLTTWPGGDEQLLATAGFHGDPIRWSA
jgi:hypothetical protein